MNLKTKEDIAQLLKRIEENDKVANAELPPVDFKDVQTYQRIRMNAGEAALQDKRAYKDYVESHIGGILLKGPYEKQVEFAEKAAALGKTLTFDTQALYRKLTDTAFFMMGGVGQLGADQVALAFTEIRLLTRNELGMFRVRYPEFQWMFGRAWMDPVSFSQGFRKSLFITNGIKITQTALLKKVFEDSLAAPVARTTVPVVIIGVPEEEETEFQTLLSHGYTTVDLTDTEITDKLITDTFVTLRDNIKSKTDTKEKN